MVKVLALGGGVIGDISGYVAGLFLRGISLINVPTTLLSQVDSSIGGKVNLNYKNSKNSIGFIYQPKIVFIDPQFLFSLNKRAYLSGIAEIVKYGIIFDKNFFDFLSKYSENILRFDRKILFKTIAICCKIKSKVVEEDETETKKLRCILNYGHTIGHAIESTTKYKITHGEAISIGMASSARIAYYTGMCSKETYESQVNLLRKFNLPIEIKGVKFNKIISYMTFDKKRSQENAFILIKSIGNPCLVYGIPYKILKMSLCESL